MVPTFLLLLFYSKFFWQFSSKVSKTLTQFYWFLKSIGCAFYFNFFFFFFFSGCESFTWLQITIYINYVFVRENLFFFKVILKNFTFTYFTFIYIILYLIKDKKKCWYDYIKLPVLSSLKLAIIPEHNGVRVKVICTNKKVAKRKITNCIMKRECVAHAWYFSKTRWVFISGRARTECCI